MPYKGITSVTFIDSLGIKKLFELSYSETSSKLTHFFSLNDTIINGTKYPKGDVVNCMLAQSITYTLKENGGSLLLVASVFNDFDKSLPKKSVVDEVEISIVDNGKIEEVFPYFNMRVDKRESKDTFLDSLITYPMLSVLGMSFDSVRVNKFANAQLHRAFYNKQQGIVAFTEANGRKWRFESMK